MIATRMTRWAMVMALLGSLLFGSAVGAATQKEVITVWSEWGSKMLPVYQKLGAIYEAQNPHVTIDWQMVGLTSQAGYEKLVVAIAGGMAPDLVTLGTWPELAQKGMLEPLDRYLAGTNLKSRFNPALWESMSLDGHIYGVPAIEGGPGRALYYNKDLFAEAGLAELGPNQVITWDELGGLAKKLTRYNADQKPNRLGYYPSECGSDGITTLGPAFNVDWYDTEKEQARFNSPQMVNILETMWRNFYEPWGYETVQQAVAGGALWTNQFNSLFATRRTATLVSGTWTIGELKKTMPDGNYGITWLPNPDRLRVMGLGSWGLYMPATRKHKEEAWKLLQFLVSPQAVATIYQELGWLAGVPRDLLNYVEPGPELTWYIRAVSEADVVSAGSPNPYQRDAINAWADVYKKVMSGQGLARPLLEEANRTLNLRIAEMRKQ